MEEEGNRGWDAGWIISSMYYYISIFSEDDVQYGYLYAGAGVTGTLAPVDVWLENGQKRFVPPAVCRSEQNRPSRVWCLVLPFPCCLTCRAT